MFSYTKEVEVSVVSWKNSLNEFCQRNHLSLPVYATVETYGMDPTQRFQSEVSIMHPSHGKLTAQGLAQSQKILAEQHAACMMVTTVIPSLAKHKYLLLASPKEFQQLIDSEAESLLLKDKTDEETSGLSSSTSSAALTTLPDAKAINAEELIEKHTSHNPNKGMYPSWPPSISQRDYPTRLILKTSNHSYQEFRLDSRNRFTAKDIVEGGNKLYHQGVEMDLTLSEQQVHNAIETLAKNCTIQKLLDEVYGPSKMVYSWLTGFPLNSGMGYITPSNQIATKVKFFAKPNELGLNWLKINL